MSPDPSFSQNPVSVFPFPRSLHFAASGCRFSLPLLVAASGCRLADQNYSWYPVAELEEQ